MWTYRARLVRAIDGDTIEVLLDLGFDVTITAAVRVAGVDTPELRGGTPASRELGREAAAFTERWCGGQGDWPLTVVTSKDRSFARYVGAVGKGGDDLAGALIADGHGIPSR